MKLVKGDKELLKNWGYSDEDINQIERATTITVYKFNYNEIISIEKANELLGREEYLSGISRSAFHCSASREIGSSGNVVSFDSSKLFK